MTNHPEGREPSMVEVVWIHLENAHDAANDLQDRALRQDIQGCIEQAMEWLEPWRTADEREKLIGGEG